MIIGGSRDRNVPTIGVSVSKIAHRRDIPVPLLKIDVKKVLFRDYPFLGII